MVPRNPGADRVVQGTQPPRIIYLVTILAITPDLQLQIFRRQTSFRLACIRCTHAVVAPSSFHFSALATTNIMSAGLSSALSLLCAGLMKHQPDAIILTVRRSLLYSWDMQNEGDDSITAACRGVVVTVGTASYPRTWTMITRISGPKKPACENNVSVAQSFFPFTDDHKIRKEHTHDHISNLALSQRGFNLGEQGGSVVSM